MGENNKYVYSEHMTSMMKVFENPHRFVEEAMYESPIKLMETEWSTQMDGNILKAVKNVGIDVDKDELLRALKYDCEQYDKGYRDGVYNACNRIVEKLELLVDMYGQREEDARNAGFTRHADLEGVKAYVVEEAIEIVKGEM